MSDWGWVALAFGIVYSTLGVYVASLVMRTRRQQQVGTK
jgi:hypothetical protein